MTLNFTKFTFFILLSKAWAHLELWEQTSNNVIRAAHVSENNPVGIRLNFPTEKRQEVVVIVLLGCLK